MCTWKVYSAFGWNVLKLSMRSSSSNVSFKTCVSLLFSVLMICPWGEWGVNVSYYYCVTVNFSFYVCQCLSYVLRCSCVGAQIFTIVMSSSWIDPLIIMDCPSLSLVIFFILRSILSDIRITTPALFCFPFSWNIFSHPFTFSLYVSLGLKWVSCRHHIYGSCFCLHSASLCLLVGAFNPFTFKVIIDIYLPITIFLIVWD